MTVQCDVLILCEVHVEVVTKSVLLFQKVSVSGNRMKPLTTKIHETCNKMWLLQDLRASDHVISQKVPPMEPRTKVLGYESSINPEIHSWYISIIISRISISDIMQQFIRKCDFGTTLKTFVDKHSKTYIMKDILFLGCAKYSVLRCWVLSIFEYLRTIFNFSAKPPVLLVAWVSTGKSHITLTIQITTND